MRIQNGNQVCCYLVLLTLPVMLIVLRFVSPCLIHHFRSSTKFEEFLKRGHLGFFYVIRIASNSHLTVYAICGYIGFWNRLFLKRWKLFSKECSPSQIESESSWGRLESFRFCGLFAQLFLIFNIFWIRKFFLKVLLLTNLGM